MFYSLGLFLCCETHIFLIVLEAVGLLKVLVEGLTP